MGIFFCDMKKVFITRVIPEKGLELLKEAGIEVNMWTQKRPLTPQELIDYCSQNDALLSVSTKIDAAFLNASKHLKVIALHSAGYDNVDVEEASRLKIPVGNTPGVLSAATADTAFLLMLACSRKAFYMHKQIQKGAWDFFEPTANLGIELYGKTLGIFGLGRIGMEMAKRCKGAYNMQIIYHNRAHNEQAEKELGAVKVPFEALLKKSDVLSVHAALSLSTREIFNLEAFSRMKTEAIFINTARGGMHNERDLKTALDQGMIWGAGLDVTNPKPMAADDPLLDRPNVCILPHIGSATRETRDAMSVLAAQNIIAGLKGERLPYAVNPEIYDL
eukprot:gene14734-17411_t